MLTWLHISKIFVPQAWKKLYGLAVEIGLLLSISGKPQLGDIWVGGGHCQSGKFEIKN